MDDLILHFDKFFKTATGFEPFPYQRRLALHPVVRSSALRIPTGLGKTEAVLLSWLWNRVHLRREDWPRRLVYCLPMRVLVEQTRDRAILILHRLGLIGGDTQVSNEGGTDRIVQYSPNWGDPGKVVVTVLMGGEERDEWDIYPERDSIIIGTQDMLLSRALNRGYGMSPYRWPITFGLLNNDCLWVVDEGQLMSGGLPTTSQLQAFREAFGTIGPSRTIWMSATIAPEWLKTVDFEPDRETGTSLELTQEDRKVRELAIRWEAHKRVQKAVVRMGDLKGLAAAVCEAHRPKGLTLLTVNTVRRAQDMAREIISLGPRAKVVLVHSRFRPPDRRSAIERLLATPGEEGTIGITTQVVEAGVDLSARVLFTEVAPWASLVQRFGRCNRFGLDQDAAIHWVDLPTEAAEREKLAHPYTLGEMAASLQVLETLQDGAASTLERTRSTLAVPPEGQVIRKKDLVELFDTTPDLTGNDTDISRFVRETEEGDLRVFWRDLGQDPPGIDEPLPSKDELCPAPIHELRAALRAGARAFAWSPLNGEWRRFQKTDPLHPGITLMLVAREGRYTPTEGWSSDAKGLVPVLPSQAEPERDDRSSVSPWLDLAAHTDQVVARASTLASSMALGDAWGKAVIEATRWHDAGKAHPAFQANLDCPPPTGIHVAAKAPEEAWRRGRPPAHPSPEDGRRRHFRHELVSGLLALNAGKDALVCYLAAAHHGKVRLSIRSFPGEARPDSPGARFARGVWDGDRVPGADLGGGISFGDSTLDLSLMELGWGPQGPSWASRMLSLRDDPKIGPFRLALLEAVVKAADERASGGKP